MQYQTSLNYPPLLPVLFPLSTFNPEPAHQPAQVLEFVQRPVNVCAPPALRDLHVNPAQRDFSVLRANLVLKGARLATKVFQALGGV